MMSKPGLSPGLLVYRDTFLLGSLLYLYIPLSIYLLMRLFLALQVVFLEHPKPQIALTATAVRVDGLPPLPQGLLVVASRLMARV